MSAGLLIFGLGYAGRAIAQAARAAGWDVVVARRAPSGPGPAALPQIALEDVPAALLGVTHLLATVPPDAGADPVLARLGGAIAAAPDLRWAGYLSSTGIYGDRAGGWVSESTQPAPGQERSRARLAAEDGWRAVAAGRALDLFRLAGIYGPGRSAFDQLRAGSARRIDRPGHLFSRIHRDDIVRAVLAAMARPAAPGVRVLHLADDHPAAPSDVVAHAAARLGMAPPPLTPFAAAWAEMSPMARGFWAENRRVSAAATKAALGLAWRHPTYREGLDAILAEEAGDGGAQQLDVGRPG